VKTKNHTFPHFKGRTAEGVFEEVDAVRSFTSPLVTAKNKNISNLYSIGISKFKKEKKFLFLTWAQVKYTLWMDVFK